MSQNVDEMPDAPSIVGTENPFPGLRPFKIEESHLFFGREGQSDEVLLKLSKSRFVGVIGPSGSGKSSFIYCGVLPILYGGFLTDASPNWEVVVTRPGSGPIDNLAESLLKTSRDYNGASADDKKIKRTIVSTLLRSSSLGLVEAIQQSRRSEDINYLVLVDQFEELFRFKDGADPNSVNETLAFINLLMEAINYEDAPIYVAITMRSDFIGECAQFAELTRKINDSHYLIPQMTRDQKRRAIEGPVAVGNAKITPRLVQQLLNDLGDNPDQLPILQHALMRTWSYWAKYKDYEDEMVDLKHYEAIGTMSEALSMHANEAYDELDEDQKRICEVLFKAITEKRGENFGIRRPTRLNEIASIADVSEGEVIEVLEKFREPGRSLVTPAHGTPLSSRSMVDISHESLMRIWVRLKNWVDDEADAVQMYQRLAEAASMYQVGKAGLWRPPDLQLALNWQAKHKPTLVWGQRYHPAFERTLIFLEYSKKEFDTEQRIKELEAKRKLQRARVTAIVFGSLAGVALIAFVYAFVQQGIAKEQEKEAQRLAIEAQKNADDALKAKKAADIAAEEARKSAEAARLAEAKAKEQQAIAEAAKIEADKNAKEAAAQAEKARQSALVAQREQKKAEQAAEAARIAEAKATREQYKATAKAMAVKSKELNNDLELEALVAQQAYIFNKNYDGYIYDNDIYNGLYSALNNINHPLTTDLAGHDKGAARALVTNATAKQIYSGGSDGRIFQWTFTGTEWKSKEIVGLRRDVFQIYALDLSPDDNLLLAAGLAAGDASQNYIELYDLRNLSAPPKQIPGFVQGIEHVEFTPDSKGAYVRDNSGRSIKFTDFTNVREVITSTVKINAFALSRDGNRIGGAGNDGVLYIWDIKNNFAKKEVYKNRSGNPLTTIAFSPDKQIVVGDDRGLVQIVPENGGTAKILSGHTAEIQEMKFNFGGTFFATTSKDKTVRMWNWKDLKQQPIVLNDHSDWVWSATFTPDDEQLLIGTQSSTNKAGETIHAWPTKITTMSSILCGYVKRNLTADEWETYAIGLKYEKTCDSYPANDK